MDIKTIPNRVKELAIWLGIGFVVIVAILAYLFIAGEPPAADLEENLAVASVQSEAAEQFGAESDEVEIVRIQETTFSDSCLGAPDPDEVCAQVLTEGYRVTIEVNNERHIYHTDITGRSIRLAR